MTLLNREWITPCERAEIEEAPQPPYLHQCGCPEVTVECESVSKTATLCGVSDPNETTIPRPYYKKGYAYLMGGTLYHTDPGGSAEKVSYTFSRGEEGECIRDHETTCWHAYDGEFYVGIERAGSAGPDRVSAVNGSAPSLLEDGCIDVVGFASITEINECDSSGSVFNSEGSFNISYNGGCDRECEPSPGQLGLRYDMVDVTLSEWTGSQWVAEGNTLPVILRECRGLSDLPGSDPNGWIATPVWGEWGPSGEPLERFSDPDTEEDALDAANETEGNSCSSLSEVRTDDYEWTVRTSKYALVASGLMIGARYTARVEIEKRPAIKNPEGSGYVDEAGEPSVWESAGSDEYTFAADAAEMIVPATGTWTDDDDDEAIDDSEVTPEIELPHVAGWEYRIKSINIELDLSNA